MSAWIVSKAHIDCLVQSLLMEGLLSSEECDRSGLKLWRENTKSVNWLYQERRPTPSYHFEPAEAPLDQWVVFKQIRCYVYQTCEHPGWETSSAHNLIEMLEAKVREHLGVKDPYADDRWDSAPWGIIEIAEAVDRACTS